MVYICAGYENGHGFHVQKSPYSFPACALERLQFPTYVLYVHYNLPDKRFIPNTTKLVLVHRLVDIMCTVYLTYPIYLA